MTNEAIARANAYRARHLVGDVPDYEARLEEVYRRIIRPGQAVIDVGALRGRHTKVFAELVGPSGKVEVFEPLPCALGWLQKAMLPFWVRVFPFAAGAHSEPTTFVFADGSPEESGLRQRRFTRPELVTPTIINVEMVSIDSLMESIRKTSFIKIDVEGAEVDVLTGAAKLIARDRPIISVEYGEPAYSVYGRGKDDLYQIARQLGYRISDLYGGLMPDIETWRAVCDHAYWDWLLVPEEAVEGWRRYFNDEPALCAE